MNFQVRGKVKQLNFHMKYKLNELCHQQREKNEIKFSKVIIDTKNHLYLIK